MFEELLKACEENGTQFHYYKDDFIIITDVESVRQTSGGYKSLEIKFKGGQITVWEDSKIRKCVRPDNLIVDCKQCFGIYNSAGEPIGFIYLEK
jgi:hypothetical protein